MTYDHNDEPRKSIWREPGFWLAVVFGILIGIVLCVMYIAAMSFGDAP